MKQVVARLRPGETADLTAYIPAELRAAFEAGRGSYQQGPSFWLSKNERGFGVRFYVDGVEAGAILITYQVARRAWWRRAWDRLSLFRG